jgi:RimJ/RimL family protein N-acetyltransferase
MVHDRAAGLAPAAVVRALVWGRRELGLRRARIQCAPANLPSRRVAGKCGFVLVGRNERLLILELSLGAGAEQ